MKRKLLGSAIGIAFLLVSAATAASPTDKAFERGHRPILFDLVVNANFKEQIATVDPAGHDVRQLTHFNAGAGEAQWAPSGGRIVVERFRKAKPGLLYSMRPGGEQRRRLTSGCHGRCLEDFEPAWSNGGGLIAFNRAFGPVDDDTGAAAEIDLMVMHRNGNNPRVLERFPFRPGARRSLESHNPDFSPDDSQLAVTLVNSLNNESAIFTYTFATDEFDRVTPWRLNAGNADWSANGRILFNSNYFAPGASDLYTITADGSGLRRLTNIRGKRSAFAPTWSPSNRRVAFSVAGPGVPPHPVVMNVGGANKHRVTSKVGVVLDWG